ncbi:MAG: UTP--glucose-1-phosphate uridylyltransferase [Candidatus Dormibacteria bacterium]
MNVRHCVIPAAGLGTRFLPATKAVPKELLPVLDRPVIQWAVEEAVAAGATDIVLVIAEGKESLAHHLQPEVPLERLLEERHKTKELEAVRHAGRLAKVTVVYQAEPLGLGHAVLCAAEVVGDQPFLCMLPDDLSVGDRPLLAQMWEAHVRHGGEPVLALERVPGEEISRYGCAEVARSEGRDHLLRGVVEKPKFEEAKSDLAIMGRYVLTPDIFDALRVTKPGALGEIQLTDAIAALLQSHDVWGLEFEGELLDVGTPAGWLATNVRLGRDDATFSSAVRSVLETTPA